MVSDSEHADGDDGITKLREMVLGALEQSGGEEWLRQHGGERFIPSYRLWLQRRPEQPG
jgi:hypothetical protein